MPAPAPLDAVRWPLGGGLGALARLRRARRLPLGRLDRALAVLASAALLPAALAGPARAQQPDTAFASADCRIAFVHPVDWEVVRDTVTDPPDPCSFAVRPRDWLRRAVANDSVDLFTISVQVVPRGVWSQVSETGFRRRGARWIVLGRQDLEAPADTIRGPGWRGVRGTATQGCDRLDGVYEGLCDAPTALVGTDSRSVMLFGGPRSEEVFGRILASLRFR